MDLQMVLEQYKPMLMIPVESRPLLNVELNNGVCFKSIVLHDIAWWRDWIHNGGVIEGGWFSFTTLGRKKNPVIELVDFDDVYEIEATQCS